MIEKSARIAAWSFLAALSGALAIACGPTVIIEGEADTGNGAGAHAAGGGGVGGSGVGGDDKPVPNDCPESCDAPGPGANCTCQRDCEHTMTIMCEEITTVQGESKTLCICTITDVFSGACYEKNPSNVCDFDLGCCAKYFSGK